MFSLYASFSCTKCFVLITKVWRKLLWSLFLLIEFPEKKNEDLKTVMMHLV